MIYPYLEELARENPDTLQIVKLNCAGENRELVNELGVRVRIPIDIDTRA